MNSEATEAPSGGTRRTVTRVGFMIVAVVLAFVLGAGWQFLRANQLEDSLEEAEHELQLTRLEATLAAAAIDAQLGNYELSRQQASDFFTALQTSSEVAPASARTALARLLDQRDAVITMLSRADAQSGSVLTRSYVQFRTAVRGPSAAAPIAAPIPPPQTDTVP